uniref:DUF19 domain-containing protein n=1 Tax=Parastrongyloides trichosuri TaxID=131310 RepID=A0A0N4ZQH0_PARTI
MLIRYFVFLLSFIILIDGVTDQHCNSGLIRDNIKGIVPRKCETAINYCLNVILSDEHGSSIVMGCDVEGFCKRTGIFNDKLDSLRVSNFFKSEIMHVAKKIIDEKDMDMTLKQLSYIGSKESLEKIEGSMLKYECCTKNHFIKECHGLICNFGYYSGELRFVIPNKCSKDVKYCTKVETQYDNEIMMFCDERRLCKKEGISSAVPSKEIRDKYISEIKEYLEDKLSQSFEEQFPDNQNDEKELSVRWSNHYCCNNKNYCN